MSLGAKLKELRLEKGDTLQTVATAVGSTKPHIWELERGTTKNPSLNLIKNLANYFGQSIEYLTGEDEKAGKDLSFARKVNNLELSERDLETLLNIAEQLSQKK